MIAPSGIALGNQSISRFALSPIAKVDTIARVELAATARRCAVIRLTRRYGKIPAATWERCFSQFAPQSASLRYCYIALWRAGKTVLETK